MGAPPDVLTVAEIRPELSPAKERQIAGARIAQAKFFIEPPTVSMFPF
jgi:hypothetical protein